VTTGNRVVLARKGRSSMVKVLWTPDSPAALNDVHVAEELGARWEGEELVADDFAGFLEAFEFYEKNEWLPDND